MDRSPLPFALFFAADAYSMAGKIMGRQSAGYSLLKSAAAYAGGGPLHAAGPHRKGEAALREALSAFGSNVPVAWHSFQNPASLSQLGALYYPAPPTASIAGFRNTLGPSSFSCFGVTHTLSSEGAMSQLASLALPPFKPWDALICTSRVARDVFHTLRDRTREAFARETGATRFPDVQTPVIPLGIETKAFAEDARLRAETRKQLGVEEHDIVLLSPGRLTFHAKYNPAPLYMVLEALPPEERARLVFIEAGVFPNEGIAKAYREAQQLLAPSVRFKSVDGSNRDLFAGLWQAADLFISLSDNIQETFGLTPVEAMAAGLPVIATDWNGYRDTVRNGIDGILIPTLGPQPDARSTLALRHALGTDTYDMYIGRVSLAAAFDLDALSQALRSLIADPALRRRMGAAGRERARQHYDWAEVLGAYAQLCGSLAEMRRKAAQDTPEAWPDRPDPFALFSTYPTRLIDPSDRIEVMAGASGRFASVMKLAMANFGFDGESLPPALVQALLNAAGQGEWQAQGLLDAAGQDRGTAERALLWLAKFGLIRIGPSGVPQRDGAIVFPDEGVVP